MPPRFIIPTALALLSICSPTGCPAPARDEALTRQTRPGERLWFLAVQSPGLAEAEMDQLVARPLMGALARQPGAEVIGARVGRARIVIYFRAPVAISSVSLAERALSATILPPGSATPQLGAAGPPGRAPERPTPPVEPGQVLTGGMSALDLLSSLGRQPGWFEAEPGPPAALSGCLVRAQAPDPQALGAAIARRQEALHHPGGPPVQLPGPGERVRLPDGQLAAWIVLPGGRSVRSVPGCTGVEALPDGERALLRWPDRRIRRTAVLETRPGRD